MSYDLSDPAERKRLYADAADLIEAAPFLNKTVFKSNMVFRTVGDRWTSKMLVDSDKPCYCTLGAVRELLHRNESLLGDGSLIVADLRAANPEIDPEESGMNSAIFEWNDQPERTKKDVVDTLRKAAE